MKRISGSIAPFAAAAIGLVGTSDVSHVEKSTAVAPAASELRRVRRAGRQLGPHGHDVRHPRKRRDAKRNREHRRAGQHRHEHDERAAADASDRSPIVEADATPVITSETTSGMTVMRMALTQSVPIGATASAACSSARIVRRGDRQAGAQADTKTDETRVSRSSDL